MAITLNGTTGITTPAVTNNGAYTGDGVVFADGTPSNTLVTTTDGNVGIAVSSPAGKLDVLGDIYARASTLRFKDSGNTTQYGAIYGDSTTFNINSGVDNLIMYSAGTERMRIDSSGNLLVGTTSTNASTVGNKILTGGNITSVCDISSANNVWTLNNINASGASYAVEFRQQGVYKGQILVSSSSTSYQTASDYRLKENIAPMTGALAKVSALKPVTYTWKSGGSSGQGFIAHELQEVFPDAVSGEKDGVKEDGTPAYQGIDASFLVATLTAAIQELKAELDTVKTELATLKGQA